MATANERVVNGVKTRILHNKDYVEVAERVRIVHELKKEFEVIESQPTQFADRCIWRVVVKVDGKQYIGNAEAKLNAPKNSPDGTNPFECAETSALGRALAWAGLGTVESIASYDEIARSQPFVAVIEQPQGAVIEARQIAQPVAVDAPLPGQLRARAKALDKNFDSVVKFLLKKSVPDDELTPSDCQLIYIALEKSAQIRAQVAANGSGQ
jgi:hypothetical protein